MNGLVTGLPVVCLVGMSLVACSAAGDGGAAGARGTEPTLTLDPGAGGPSEAEGDSPDAGESEMPSPGAPGVRHDDDDAPSSHCDCDFDLPGIDVDSHAGGIAVTIDLPGDAVVVIVTTDGTVTTSPSGVEIAGDVVVELGAHAGLPLTDARLHVALPPLGEPTLTGSASVAGSWLAGAGCDGGSAPLPVSVALDVAAAGSLGIEAAAAVRLGVDLPTLTLNGAGLPAASGDALTLVEAQVEVLTDGGLALLDIDARLESSVDVWTSLVPVAPAGPLSVTAKVLGGSLASIALTGDMKLIGDALASGSTPLLSIELPDATVALDGEGASLSAEATVSLHPGLSLTGEALVTGEFTEEHWSLEVCGGVTTSLLGGADLGTCVNIGEHGVEPCRLPMD